MSYSTQTETFDAKQNAFEFRFKAVRAPATATKHFKFKHTELNCFYYNYLIVLSIFQRDTSRCRLSLYEQATN